MTPGRGCPPWIDDTEHTSPKFAALGRQVLNRVVAECRSACPDLANIKSWHRALFADYVPLDYYAGEFRQLDIKRPCLANEVYVNGRQGFPFIDVLPAMSSFSLRLRREVARLEDLWPKGDPNNLTRELAKIVGVAIGAFIHIHPFINGNGRTSRLLWTGLLSRYGFSPESSIVRRPGPPYPEVMKQVMSGDYGPAVALVLIALAKTPKVKLNEQ